jgi:hypothetical protein
MDPRRVLLSLQPKKITVELELPSETRIDSLGLNNAMRTQHLIRLILLSIGLVAVMLFLGCATSSDYKVDRKRRVGEDWQTTLTILNQSDDATFVAVPLYLDGGSVGYIFTNRFGVLEAFVPHPGSIGFVRNQPIFLGQPGTGRDGIKVKAGSRAERKLKCLVQIAGSKTMPPHYRAELDTLTRLLATRQFEWKLDSP